MTTALTPPHLSFGAHPEDEERLTLAVLASPRLLGAVPAEEIEPLFLAYRHAEEAVAAIRNLPAPNVRDAGSEVFARLKRGEEIDPAALVTELAEAERHRDDRRRVAEILQNMPALFATEIVQTVADYESDFYDALAADLADVLDHAAEIVAELDGVTSADQAIEKDKADEWRAFLAVVAEYAAVRRDHAALLKASGEPRFTSEKGMIHQTRAALPGVDAVVSEFAEKASGQSTDLRGRPVPLSAPVFDVNSSDHLLWVLAHRSALRPRIGRPSDPTGVEVIAVTGMTPTDRMSPEHRAQLYAQVRDNAANRDADARKDGAWDLDPA